MKLTAEIIEAFSGLYLSPKYDSPQPTPQFHRDCWERYCSDHPACATAAPRNHAKSTGLTHDFILAVALWRVECYIILIGSSEEMAVEHLGDIANELKENEDLIRDFKIKSILTDQKTDIIVECQDGYQFRIIARGSEQKIRGRKWRGRRPGLILFDDIEDDEQVANRDRRVKFRNWFFRACKQALRDGGKIRGHGTILHEDSLLSRLMKNKSWNSQLYKAHAGFSDFSKILWPEKFPESRLRAIRKEFIDEGDSAGYSQEFLNDPIDNDAAYLKKDHFLPMLPKDHEIYKRFAVGVDFAISKKDSANRTSFTVGGKDMENILHHVDQRKGRWGSLEIVEEFFSIHERWNPEVFFVEDGQIWKAVKDMLFEEMQKRDRPLAIEALVPISDKAARGRPFQKRMKAGMCRFDKDAEWYPEYEDELLRFTGIAEATLDDQFDSSAILSKGLTNWTPPDEDDAMSEDEVEFSKLSAALKSDSGRSAVTGY